jgi:hypothetical protein
MAGRADKHGRFALLVMIIAWSLYHRRFASE